MGQNHEPFIRAPRANFRSASSAGESLAIEPTTEHVSFERLFLRGQPRRRLASSASVGCISKASAHHDPIRSFKMRSANKITPERSSTVKMSASSMLQQEDRTKSGMEDGLVDEGEGPLPSEKVSRVVSLLAQRSQRVISTTLLLVAAPPNVLCFLLLPQKTLSSRKSPDSRTWIIMPESKWWVEHCCSIARCFSRGCLSVAGISAGGFSPLPLPSRLPSLSPSSLLMRLYQALREHGKF